MFSPMTNVFGRWVWQVGVAGGRGRWAWQVGVKVSVRQVQLQ